MEVPAIKTQHLACQRKLLLPEVLCFRRWQKTGRLLEEPKTITPYPIALWKLPQKRDKESKIVRDEISESLMIGSTVIIWATRARTFELVS